MGKRPLPEGRKRQSNNTHAQRGGTVILLPQMKKDNTAASDMSAVRFAARWPPCWLSLAWAGLGVSASFQ